LGAELPKVFFVTEIVAMRIELASLEKTDGKFAHSYEPGELTLSDERTRLTEPLTVTGRVWPGKGQIVAKGELATRVQIECDRCLNTVELPVEKDFRVEYVTAQSYDQGPAAAELSEADMSLSVFDGEGIDLDDLAREQLLLALPERILCQEACKGLCPMCGIDRNAADCNCQVDDIDPRWEALKELVDGK
jgi:uncharacterized protein